MARVKSLPPRTDRIDLILFPGDDSFGHYNMYKARRITDPTCVACDAPREALIQYTPLSPKHARLPAGIEVEATILKAEGNYIGVTCGCYAKLHRQVAHIVDKMEARK